MEVRKKRTYVKRDPAELGCGRTEAAQDVAGFEAVNAEPLEGRAAAAGVAGSRGRARGRSCRPRPLAEAVELSLRLSLLRRSRKSLRVEEDLANLDPEVLRQRAAARRMKQEADEAEARKVALDARKAEEERKEAEAATKAKAEKAQETIKRPKRLHDAPTSAPGADQRKKKPGARGDRGPQGRGKQRGHNLSLSDLDARESGMLARRGSARRSRLLTRSIPSTVLKCPPKRKSMKSKLPT